MKQESGFWTVKLMIEVTQIRSNLKIKVQDKINKNYNATLPLNCRSFPMRPGAFTIIG